jgi:hypothetical protein
MPITMSEKKVDILFAVIYYFLLAVLLVCLFLKARHIPLGSQLFVPIFVVGFIIFRIENRILKKRIDNIKEQINNK